MEYKSTIDGVTIYFDLIPQYNIKRENYQKVILSFYSVWESAIF